MDAMNVQSSDPVEHVPLETLALDDRASYASSASTSGTSSPAPGRVRPESHRSTTEPSTLLSVHLKERPRNRSPYSRTHLRSQSHASVLAAPPMTRTKSLPIVTSLASFSASPARSPVRGSSPARQPSLRASPRHSLEETMPRSVTPSFMDIEIISEDAELDINPRGHAPSGFTPPTLHSASFQRSNSGRRRPSSPLHHQYSSVNTAPPSMMPSSPATSLRFNETFPRDVSGASGLQSSSSFSSTPTSFRSRSPSISSLETIPDSPDAEEEAQEDYRVAQLKAAADAAEEEAAAEKNGSRDGAARSSGRKDRKRWSVCGAERRADFEMETIWED